MREKSNRHVGFFGRKIRYVKKKFVPPATQFGQWNNRVQVTRLPRHREEGICWFLRVWSDARRASPQKDSSWPHINKSCSEATCTCTDKYIDGKVVERVESMVWRGYEPGIIVEVKEALIANGGAGFSAWEPFWVSADNQTLWGVGSNWENVAFFDFNNNLLTHCGIEAFGDYNVNKGHFWSKYVVCRKW